MTSEVLRIISSSPGELQPVFEAMLEMRPASARQKLGNLWLREGDKFRIVAIHGGPREYHDYLFAGTAGCFRSEKRLMGRIASKREVIQIDDISKAFYAGA